jgi:hypothetical protein
VLAGAQRLDQPAPGWVGEDFEGISRHGSRLPYRNIAVK